MSFGFKKHKVHQSGGTIGATGKLPPNGGAKVGGTGTATETAVPGAVANQIKKFNANGNLLPGTALEREKAERELVQATVITNPGVDAELSDKNGNTGSIDSVDDTGGNGGGRNSSTGRSTPRLQPAKKDSHGAPYRSNRFGFRTNNIVRPASVGLQPRVANADFDKHSVNNNNNNNNNNIHTTNNNSNNVYVVTDKRRSKSASSAATARTTFTPLPAPTTTTTAAGVASGGTAGPAMTLHQHAYGGGASALHRPLPKYQAPGTKINQPVGAPDSNGGGAGDGGSAYQQPVTKCNQGEHKNTQHSASTQRQTGHQPHQYTPASEAGQNALAAGGLHAKPPAQPASAAKLGQQESLVASKFTLHTSSLPKPQYPVSISLAGTTSGPVASSRYTMDTKGAKHAVNVSRKEFANTSAAGAPALEDTTTTTTSSIRMPRQRYRNLEMVMSGRHKFEVRDLEALTTEPIVPLPLPELPSAFGSTANQRTAPLSGLIRSTELAASASATTFDDDIDINDNRYEPIEANVQDGEEQEENTAATYTIDSAKAGGAGAGLLESTSTRCPSDGESFEEEKLLRDKNSSEKSLKGALMKELAEQSVESKSSSPGSSRASWCNAGEALASKDFGSLSLSSSEESRAGKNGPSQKPQAPAHDEADEEDVSSVTITAGNPSAFSSMSAPVPMDVSTNLDSVSEVQISFTDPGTDPLASSETDVPKQMFRNEQSKFAEMAAAISDVLLLDDETSPTDSLVSSCTENSDDVKKPRHNKKVAENCKEKEKDIDEISPELEELTSPVSPGTPTHASNSLSLSDGGRDFLIDDEIADQPGLVFDEGSTLDLGSLNLNLGSQNTDTPTLKDSHNRPNAASAHHTGTAKTGPPVPKPRKVMPAAYESPALSRKSTRSGNRMVRAESLDTLSPCDSIASDDFMLDFDCNSSMDSIDRVARSSVGGSATGLHSMDELQLWSELENKGGHIIREWSSLLRSNPNSMTNSFNNNHNTSRESITSQLPARARLLTRRLQNNATPTNGSESPRSIDSLPRRTFAGAYKTATLSQFHNLANNNNNGNGCTDSGSTATNSAEDLTLLDKSLRNSMLQDVVHFKKQLVRLRRILQEDEENLMMTDTLNPFESNNGQFFTTAAAVAAATIGNNGNGPATDAGNGGLGDSNRQQEQGVLIRESGVAALALLDDQRQELADLRRQVVYLQGELTTKDRTIRQQQNLIEKYEAERERQGTSNGAVAEATGSGSGAAAATSDTSSGDRNHSETISQATQTERLRPVSFGGQEGLGSRNEHPTTPKNGLRTPTAANSSSSSSPNHGQTPQNSTTNGPSFSANRSTPTKTQISSVYTQLSSVRHSMTGSSAPSTPTGPGAPTALRRTSLGSSHNLSSFGLHGTPSPGSKPVRTTHIGTLAATGRQPTNGDRIPVLANGTAKHTKGAPNRTPPSAQTNGTIPTGSSPSKPSGLNGMAKRTTATIIRPPSSFGANIAPLDAQQTMLKSKSAPATPLVPNGKLLTAPATGNTTDTSLTNTAPLNGAHSTVNGRAEASGENESSGRETSDEWESDKDSVINGAIMGAVKLLPNGPTGCSDGSTTIGSTPNGIVGH
ncbi:nuclear pore complex protein DDB_G0274915 [Anopheles ziemanni]|nr:nuclear pore complex protein DDB_G0274915 [Anopheles ziemanni]